jgi:hypothetical protein
MSLYDDFMNGQIHDHKLYWDRLNQLQQQDARRITMDGAQMQLENDAITRDARLRNVLAQLANSTDLNEQQLAYRRGLDPLSYDFERQKLLTGITQSQNQQGQAGQEIQFRQGLSPLQYDAKKAELGASIAGNTLTTTNAEHGNTIAKDIFPDQRRAAQGQAAYAGMQGDVVRDNLPALRATSETNILTGQKSAENQYGMQETLGRQLAEQRTTSDLMHWAIENGGQTTPDLINLMRGASYDPRRTPEERRIAGNLVNSLTLQQVEYQKAFQGKGATMNPAVPLIENTPLQMAEQMGIQVLGQNPYGEYQIDVGGGNIELLSPAELKSSIARRLGVDASPWQKDAEISLKERAARLSGNTQAMTAGVPDAFKPELGFKLSDEAKQRQQRILYGAQTHALQGLGYSQKEDANGNMIWVDDKGQVVDPAAIMQYLRSQNLAGEEVAPALLNPKEGR